MIECFVKFKLNREINLSSLLIILRALRKIGSANWASTRKIKYLLT